MRKGENLSSKYACPKCSTQRVGVYDSRYNYKTQVYARRRRCKACGHKWQTMEIGLEAFARLQAYDEMLAKVKKG